MMEADRFSYLLQRYQNNTASMGEKNELAAFIREHEKDEGLADILQTFIGKRTNPQMENDRLHEIMDSVLKTDKAKVPGEVVSLRFSPIRRSRWWWAAASVLLLLSAAAYLWTSSKNTDQTVSGGNQPLHTDILPGGERAVLRLADGSQIVLDSAANGALARQGNAQVVKLSNGQITYKTKGVSRGEVMMNTMTTPRGGQYQLTLPDGTKVWLNAASSITFPTAFVGNDRPVKITGEVYMEVTKDKSKPFIVDVDGKSSVEVLGTSFNINSYDNEEKIKTTLIEGSVKIKAANNQSAILKPGHQAIVDQILSVIPNADTDQAIAWKIGLFSFNDTDLKSVMRQLERWYDVKVVYEGTAPDISLKGKMYRNVNLSAVINFLQKTGVNCRMEGKTIIVE